MILVKNWNFPLLVFEQNGLWNNVCWSSNLKKTSLPRLKSIDLTQWKYWDFQRGQPMISVKNWKFHLSLFLDKMSLEIMSDDHPSRKLALLNYKNINFTKSRNCIFFKGVNPWFSSKTANFLYAFLTVKA